VKVAYFSPLPPSRSGVADYSALLLPELGKRVEIEVARPGRFRRAPQVRAGSAGFARRRWRRTPPDVSLYHIGNDPEGHDWIARALAARPGLVVLHEFVLHHLVAGLTLARGDARGYLDAMERGHGLAGRLLAYGVIDNRIPPLWETRPEAFPLAGDVLADATGLIVHSAFVEERARAAGFDGPVWRIPHPAWPQPEVTPATVDGSPVIGCFGHLNETKRIPQLLAAFARLRASRPGARLLLVGALAPRLASLEVPEGVIREDYVTEERLWSLMAACDGIVSLRAPTMGETSGSAIRALTLGKPLVVSDVGWFSELPDEAAVRVPVDEREIETLAAALERLAADEQLREAMGTAARALAERDHALGRVADLYASALEEAGGGEMVRTAVLRDVAEAAAGVGIGTDDPAAAELAARLDEVGLGG
jgi:glycosyltransferase involved in cell wall biosynthesis